MSNKHKTKQPTTPLSDTQLIAEVMEKYKNTRVLFPKMLERAKAALSNAKMKTT